jgi:hypothetical protein
MSYFTDREVESLVSLLDQNRGFKRPETQTTGYSNSLSEQEISAEEKSSAVGGIPIPATVVNKTIGLPVPSNTKEGKAITEKLNELERPRPKGNSIWTPDEMSKLTPSGAPAKTAESKTGLKEARQQPEYDVLYKQTMSAEDVYLGVDLTRDGSSLSCDGIVARIKLPRVEKPDTIRLTVEPYFLILETDEYYLKASVPQKVVENKANAKWDSAKKTLTVTLTTDMSDKQAKILA